VAAVVQPGRPLLVIASDHDADPVDCVARDRGDLGGGQPLRQQPDNLPMAAHHRTFGPTLVCFQFVNTKICVD
jgi:hypothetical protein